MNNNRFSLIENAFYVLKADFNSSRSDISELVDDAEFEEQFDPEKIQRAQHNLFGPVTRLEEELSWFPELSPPQIANIIDLMSQNDLAGLQNTAEHLPELSKANLLIHIAGAGNISTPLCKNLIETWEEIEKGAVLASLNAQRIQAGIPTVDMAQLNTALDNLERRYSETIALAVWDLDHPGKAMEEIVEAVLDMRIASSIFEKFVRSYDRLSEPALARIREEIDTCIEKVRSADGNLNALVSIISNLLVKWDDINQAVQVFEQHHGHEEARSKQIYEQLRSLCMLLAVERNEVSSAQRLAKALLRTFPELESVAEVLRDDVLQLEALDQQQKDQRCVDPLVAACEIAKENPSEVSGELRRNAFSTSALGLLSDVFKSFQVATSSLNDVNVAYFIVRDLALHLNNEQGNAEAAFRLIDGLLTYQKVKPNQELLEKLVEERSVLHHTWKMKELEKNKGDVSAMLRTVDELLRYARNSDRGELIQLKLKLEKVRNHVEQKKNEKIGWWVVLGTIILLVIAFGG